MTHCSYDNMVLERSTISYRIVSFLVAKDRSIKLTEVDLDGRKTHVIANHIDTFYDLA